MKDEGRPLESAQEQGQAALCREDKWLHVAGVKKMGWQGLAHVSAKEKNEGEPPSENVENTLDVGEVGSFVPQPVRTV